jgi:predicted nucleic acid-binding protein
VPAGTSAPGAQHAIRPVAVLDAAVLVPPGLCDLLLSCADQAVFRPVWQAEIENEVRRNGTRLAIARRGASREEAVAALDRTLERMNTAFPDARLSSELWVPLVPEMTNDAKDRHVLAAAVGADATHLVTSNLRDFPVPSRPPGIEVIRPDAFLLGRLTEALDLVVSAVEAMAARHTRPAHTPQQLAEMIADGKHAPRFGTALRKLF